MLIQRKNRKANLAKVATVAVLAMMAGTAQAQKISPQGAVKNIIDNNVSLKALGSTLEAQRLLEDGEARALEPAEVDFERLWASDGGENRWNAGITQGFDWPGVYAKRRRAADARGMALQLEYNARKLEVAQEARQAIAEAVYAQKKLSLMENMLQNMSKLAESTNLGYKHGERTILDVKKVNMELATMEWNVSEARNSLATAMATLTALNDNQPLDIDLSVYDLQPLLSLQEYMDNAAKANPAVLAAQQQSTAAGLRADAAKAAMLPGFSVGLRHAYEEETHYNGISVGVKLPFLGNRQAQKAALMEADGYHAQAIAETSTATAQTQALYNQATRMRERFVALSKSTLQEDYPRLLDMAFKGGEINMLTYLQELNYYLDACSNLLDAEYSLNTTLINLNRYSTPL